MGINWNRSTGLKMPIKAESKALAHLVLEYLANKIVDWANLACLWIRCWVFTIHSDYRSYCAGRSLVGRPGLGRCAGYVWCIGALCCADTSSAAMCQFQDGLCEALYLQARSTGKWPFSSLSCRKQSPNRPHPFFAHWSSWSRVQSWSSSPSTEGSENDRSKTLNVSILVWVVLPGQNPGPPCIDDITIPSKCT